MGLTSWKGEKVRKSDITIAKNYLTEKELKSLNRIVTMYLDYAEAQAERRKPMYMKDSEEKLKIPREYQGDGSCGKCVIINCLARRFDKGQEKAL
jgi:hypothetical protein